MRCHSGPETLQEVRVNASMYDAQQGSTSGAHIDMATSAGTNKYHGAVYAHRGTDWINAAPFFFNQDQDIPANDKVPQLHRYILGGTFVVNHQGQALRLSPISTACIGPGDWRLAARRAVD